MARKGRWKCGRRGFPHFRFSHRYGDAAAANEAGVFLYTQKIGDAEPKPEYIGFEALLLKGEDGWKIMME